MWIVESLPSGMNICRSFETKEEAIAELRSHICRDCLDGIFRYVDSSQESGFSIDFTPIPDPNSLEDLLNTGCGAEWSVSEKFEHESHCNASRFESIGCDGCSCVAGKEIKKRRHKAQYTIERIILRHIYENRIDGYTLEMAKEIADALDY